MKENNLMNWTLADFEKYNARYDAGAFSGSEANRYDLRAIRYWISVRDRYKYVLDPDTQGDWKQLKIIEGWGTKFGIDYIYIEEKQKLWRISRTSDEFYHRGCYHENVEI